MSITRVLAVAAVGLVSAALSYPVVAQIAHASIVRSLEDSNRPAADVARDDERKAAETLFLSTVQAGDKVAELMPAGGYYTRLLSKMVGPKGHVYAVVTTEDLAQNPKAADAVKAIAANTAVYPNVTVISPSYADFKAPEPLNIVWTTDNYHDMHNAGIDMAKFNKAVYDSLKLYGFYFIVDHSAAAGSGFTQAKTLHRADAEAVKAEVVAAGFQVDTESNVLSNDKDDRTKPIFDPSVRGHTDQFVIRFIRTDGKPPISRQLQ